MILPRGRLVILMYHRVLDVPDPFHGGDVSANQFDRQLATLKRFFNVLPLHDAARSLVTGNLPSRAVSITFDDGYADNFDLALPLLKRHGLNATFFIATGYLNGGRMWNDTVIESVARTSQFTLDLSDFHLGIHHLSDIPARVRTVATLLRELKYHPFAERQQLSDAIAHRAAVDLPNHLMMTSEQVRRLADAGMEIGAHTVNHPILAGSNDVAAADEVNTSIRVLREITRREVRTFAYPNGKPEKDYILRDVNIVGQTPIETAVSTAWGYASAETHRLQLPRIAPWEQSPARFALRVFRSYFGAPATLL